MTGLKRWRSFSILKKIFIFQLGLLLIVVFLVGGTSIFLIARHLKVTQREHLELVAHDIVYHLQAELKARVKELETAIAGRPLQVYAASFHAGVLEEFLVNFRGSFPRLSYLNEFGLEEVRVVNGEVSSEYRNFSGHELFRRLLSGPAGQVVFRTIPYSEELEEPAVEMAVLRREYFGDRFTGILLAEIPLEELAIGICLDCDHGSSYIIFDEQGRLLLGSRVELLQESVFDPAFSEQEKQVFKRAAAGEVGFARVRFFTQDSFVSFQPEPGLRAAVMVGVAYDEFMRVPWQLMQTVSVLFLVVFFFGSLASYLVSRSITGPIGKLLEAVASVARGDFSRKVAIDSRDEFEELADKFNLMTADLDSFVKREKRLLEEKAEAAASLLKARKMEAIGLMAGGVAHDLNNILSGITGYPEILLLKLDPGSELVRPIKKIQEAGFRAAAVVADLLTVARGVAVVREKQSLNGIVEDYLQSPEFKQIYARHSRVRVQAELTPALPLLECSRIHMLKVLMNLVGNALEAIDGPGTVLITTGREEKGDGGERLRLVIRDDGPGIDAKELEHIFEPFYSRKVMGRSGTGLGLTIVWNTVKEHGGQVEVESSSAGTTFTVWLPACGEAEAPLSASREQPDVLPALRGQGRILVIDDEAEQLEIAAALLVSLGYQVETAAGGSEALEILGRERFDLLLLDMIMEKNYSGLTVYRQALKIYPRQKAIVVSGFSVSEEVNAVLALGGGAYLRKPFSLVELGRAVQRELARPLTED
ncbi:MAG: response regulator [Deltaproteobacteria bacterium]|nr:response regulator [Deltaproteobacteria bacterium]